MSKITDKELAKKILKYLGDGDNIVSITHCATRLRPTLKSIDIVDISALKNLEGVTGLVKNSNNIQIIIGTNVGNIYGEMVKNLEPSSFEDHINKKPTEKKKISLLLNEFIQLVVSIFSPLLPLLAGSGIIRGFTILANEFGILSKDSSTNLMLTLTATSVFYFLPILVAITASKRFNTSPYIAIAVVGALLMPDFLKLLQGNGGNLIYMYGLPVSIFNYTSQILPAIITVWIQSKLEFILNKRIPSSLQMIVTPTILLLILLPLMAVIIGPLGNYISIGLANFVSYIANINQIITGAITGGIWNILILFGVHWAPNTMVIIPEIAKEGHSAFIAYGANANFGMAGAAFAFFLKSKSKKIKTFSATAITSVMLSGIVEPAIYGLGVKFRTPLIAGCLGAALGGAFMGGFNVVGNAFVFGGLTTIPAFAGSTLWAYLIGITISFFGGLIFTLILGVKDSEAEMK